MNYYSDFTQDDLNTAQAKIDETYKVYLAKKRTYESSYRSKTWMGTNKHDYANKHHKPAMDRAWKEYEEAKKYVEYVSNQIREEEKLKEIQRQQAFNDQSRQMALEEYAEAFQDETEAPKGVLGLDPQTEKNLLIAGIGLVAILICYLLMM